MSGTLARLRGRPIDLAIVLAIGIAAGAVGFVLARPLGAASIAPDAQAAVLHFDRIVSGRLLEQYVYTTPKPLLTAVFGVLYTATGDWRALSIATLAAYIVAVILAVILARRYGGLVAAIFAGVALIVSSSLLFDVGFALATPWAAMGWFGAGLAVSGIRPRYALTGVLLCLATLARLETAVLSGVVLACLVAAWAFSHAPLRAGIRPPAAAWLVPLIAFAAFPVMMLHDWRLTGDPLFWSGVAERYTEQVGSRVPSGSEIGNLIIGRYWAFGSLTLLAIVGAIRLALTRAWPILIGLAGLGPAVAVFLVFLAMRGIYVSERYLAAEDVAVAWAAAIGAGAIASRVGLAGFADIAGRAGIREMLAPLASSVGLAAAALLVAGPLWQADPTLPDTVATSRRLAASTDQAVSAIAPVLDTIPAARRVLAPGDEAPQPIVLAPKPVRIRLAISLGLALPMVATTNGDAIDLASGYPGVGQIVFHSPDGDTPAARWPELEVSRRTIVDGVAVDPLLSHPGRAWVLRIEPAP